MLRTGDVVLNPTPPRPPPPAAAPALAEDGSASKDGAADGVPLRRAAANASRIFARASSDNFSHVSGSIEGTVRASVAPDGSRLSQRCGDGRPTTAASGEGATNVRIDEDADEDASHRAEEGPHAPAGPQHDPFAIEEQHDEEDNDAADDEEDDDAEDDAVSAAVRGAPDEGGQHALPLGPQQRPELAGTHAGAPRIARSRRSPLSPRASTSSFASSSARSLSSRVAPHSSVTVWSAAAPATRRTESFSSASVAAGARPARAQGSWFNRRGAGPRTAHRPASRRTHRTDALRLQCRASRGGSCPPWPRCWVLDERRSGRTCNAEGARAAARPLPPGARRPRWTT